MRASTLLSWVALWAFGFVPAFVRARNGGCGSGSSLTAVSMSPAILVIANDSLVVLGQLGNVPGESYA
jgi:hypothetical protein